MAIKGGHLLACRGGALRVQVQHPADFRMAIPETAAFLSADLSRDARREVGDAEKDH